MLFDAHAGPKDIKLWTNSNPRISFFSADLLTINPCHARCWSVKSSKNRNKCSLSCSVCAKKSKNLSSFKMESTWLECLKTVIIHLFQFFHNQGSFIYCQTRSVCCHFGDRLINFFNIRFFRQSFEVRFLLWQRIVLVSYLFVFVVDLIIRLFCFTIIDDFLNKLWYLCCPIFLLNHLMQVNRNKEH